MSVARGRSSDSPSIFSAAGRGRETVQATAQVVIYGGGARGVTAQLAVVGTGQEASGTKPRGICTMAEDRPRRSWAGKPHLTALCLSAKTMGQGEGGVTTSPECNRGRKH